MGLCMSLNNTHEWVSWGWDGLSDHVCHVRYDAKFQLEGVGLQPSLHPPLTPAPTPRIPDGSKQRKVGHLGHRQSRSPTIAFTDG